MIKSCLLIFSIKINPFKSHFMILDEMASILLSQYYVL
ncbi:hypothetical protein ABVS_3195 [Acinetobacter lwoffii]|nr:hypothetical protein ABVS_3195 [Acinetobacter lwoffii]